MTEQDENVFWNIQFLTYPTVGPADGKAYLVLLTAA
jgi:hypothetical protein